MRPGDPREIPDVPPGPATDDDRHGGRPAGHHPAAPAERHPAAVPDDGPPESPGAGMAGQAERGVVVAAGTDSDDDGVPDTLFGHDGEHLLVHTDLDGDGTADRTLRIGPEGGPDAVLAPSPPVGPPDDAGHPPLVELFLRLLRVWRGPLG